jgi:hypothetical protein
MQGRRGFKNKILEHAKQKSRACKEGEVLKQI